MISHVIASYLLGGREKLAKEYFPQGINGITTDINRIAFRAALNGYRRDWLFTEGINGQKADIEYIVAGYIVGGHKELTEKYFAQAINGIMIDINKIAFIVALIGYKIDWLLTEGINGQQARLNWVVAGYIGGEHKELAKECLTQSVGENMLDINKIACGLALNGCKIDWLFTEGINGQKADIEYILTGYIGGEHKELVKEYLAQGTNGITTDINKVAFSLACNGHKAEWLFTEGINGQKAYIEYIVAVI